MIHYFLNGWKQELDGCINAEWKKTEGEVYNRAQIQRRLHHHAIGYLYDKISKKDMVEEFRPFAVAYIEKEIKGKLDSYEIYRGIQ